MWFLLLYYKYIYLVMFYYGVGFVVMLCMRFFLLVGVLFKYMWCIPHYGVSLNKGHKNSRNARQKDESQ